MRAACVCALRARVKSTTNNVMSWLRHSGHNATNEYVTHATAKKRLFAAQRCRHAMFTTFTAPPARRNVQETHRPACSIPRMSAHHCRQRGTNTSTHTHVAHANATPRTIAHHHATMLSHVVHHNVQRRHVVTTTPITTNTRACCSTQHQHKYNTSTQRIPSTTSSRHVKYTNGIQHNVSTLLITPRTPQPNNVHTPQPNQPPTNTTNTPTTTITQQHHHHHQQTTTTNNNNTHEQEGGEGEGEECVFVV